MENRPAADLDDLDWWTRPVAERDATFAWLRANEPRSFVKERDTLGMLRGGGFWALTRFDDIREVSRRPADFCSGQGTLIFDQSPAMREYRGSIITMDDPEHTRLRKIVSRAFTPRALERVRADVELQSRNVLTAISQRGTCDFVTDVAALLPVRVINDMMGVSRCYESCILQLTNVIMGASDPEYVSDQSPRAVGSAVFAASQELAGLLTELAAERIKAPKDDVISVLVAANNEDNLTPQELAAFFILLITAGNETTRNALAHGLHALTLFPDQRTLWRSDPSTYTKPAVEELVRWASPVLHMRRTVTRDGVRLGDLQFTAGDKVVLWYRSANQDEDYFADGTKFDITRKPNPHLGFGSAGPHFCLGANLARLELSIFFETMFQLLPDLHSVGEPQFLRGNFVHGIKHLHAAFPSAPASTSQL
jgi:cytochrome P450